MGSKDRLLEVIQHNGDWMSIPQMVEEAHVNEPFVRECIKDFVGYQVIQERKNDDEVTEYRAILKKDDS